MWREIKKMKQTIRFNSFETNSSSTHSLVIIPDKDYAAWNNNELYYCRWVYGDTKKFIEKNNGRLLYTKQELIDGGIFSDAPKKEDFEDEDEFEQALDDYLADSDFVTADTWSRDELEEDETTYITDSGEKLHIICQYGYDV